MRWTTLRDSVERNGNVLSVTMERLRNIHGTAKLGTKVRQQINRELSDVGLGHCPLDLPKYQHEQVRLFRNGTGMSELINIVLRPGRQNDKKLLAKFAEAHRPRARGAKRTKVNFSPSHVASLYKGGKSISEIAQAAGYAPGHGQNRVRESLIKAGIYKKSRRKKRAV